MLQTRLPLRLGQWRKAEIKLHDQLGRLPLGTSELCIRRSETMIVVLE
jgi:hypothetical protein